MIGSSMAEHSAELQLFIFVILATCMGRRFELQFLGIPTCEDGGIPRLWSDGVGRTTNTRTSIFLSPYNTGFSYIKPSHGPFCTVTQTPPTFTCVKYNLHCLIHYG